MNTRRGIVRITENFLKIGPAVLESIQNTDTEIDLHIKSYVRLLVIVYLRNDWTK